LQNSDGDGLVDLNGLRTRLPYIASLGADALWITPFYPSPMTDHGYAVADHGEVHPALKDLQAFE